MYIQSIELDVAVGPALGFILSLGPNLGLIPELGPGLYLGLCSSWAAEGLLRNINKDEKFLLFAFEQTFNSNHKFPLAAVLVVKKKVVSHGCNKYKSHPKQKRKIDKNGIIYGGSIHAELDCLIRAPETEGGTLYVARRKALMSFGLAKPCSSCQELLKQYGIKEVYYTLNRGFNDTGMWYEKL